MKFQKLGLFRDPKIGQLLAEPLHLGQIVALFLVAILAFFVLDLDMSARNPPSENSGVETTPN